MSVNLGLKFQYSAEAWAVDRRVSDVSATLRDKALNDFLDQVLPHNGQVIWRGRGHNLVTDVGARWIINHGFVAANTTIPWYVMLKNVGTGLASDTAQSHAWTENGSYAGNRPALTLATATSGRSTTNGANLASYTINATVAIAGFALITNAPKSPGNTGTMFSISDFASVYNGVATNILRVTAVVSA